MNDERLIKCTIIRIKEKGKIIIFMRISYQNQCRISFRWVNTCRMINSEKVKSCLLARGFKENQEASWTYSPTCAKEI